jgi:hypothetical protein
MCADAAKIVACKRHGSPKALSIQVDCTCLARLFGRAAVAGTIRTEQTRYER